MKNEKNYRKEAYHPLTVARDLGYQNYILEAIRKCKSYEESEKILIDARHGNFKKYKKV